MMMMISKGSGFGRNGGGVLDGSKCPGEKPRHLEIDLGQIQIQIQIHSADSSCPIVPYFRNLGRPVSAAGDRSLIPAVI